MEMLPGERWYVASGTAYGEPTLWVGPHQDNCDAPDYYEVQFAGWQEDLAQELADDFNRTEFRENYGYEMSDGEYSRGGVTLTTINVGLTRTWAGPPS